MSSSQVNLHLPEHFTDSAYVVAQTAGDGPLDVTIALPDEVSYEADIPAISELRKLVSRLRSLTLDMPYQEAWQKFVTGIGEGQAAPILESLIITVKRDVLDYKKTGPFAELSTCFTPSPVLKNLQFPAWPLPASTPPQLATVTSLAIITPFHGVYLDPIYPLIQTTSNTLEKFTFKSLDVGAESDPNLFAAQRIFFPRLTSVDVTVPGFGLDILSNLDAPKLAEVRLDGFRDEIPLEAYDMEDWGEDMTRPLSKILAVLSQRSKSIRRLHLRYAYLEHPTPEFSRILAGETFPKLEELVLEKSNITDAALQGARSPLIKKIELSNCRYVTQGASA